ncbi:MAG: prolyl oligopeptidase family protein [Phycisphaerales bacterium]
MHLSRSALVGLVAVSASIVTPALAQPGVKLTYPPTERDEAKFDTYHGTKVADPYQWMEEADTPGSAVWPKIAAWVEAQNKVTFGYLGQVPQRDAIKSRITNLTNYERFGLPFVQGGKYFYSRNDGLQNQSVWYVADSLEAAPRVLIDPNTYSKEGVVAIAGLAVTEDARLMAYGIAEKGSDWNVWRVRDIATGKDLPDTIEHVKFGGASWLKDGSGFFYSRFPAPRPGEDIKAMNKNQSIYFHKLGDSQDKDTLVYARPDQPEWYLFGSVTDDGRYFVISGNPYQQIENALYYKDLADPHAKVMPLLDKLDAQYNFVGNDGPTFFVQSDLDAPRGRVWAININHPERAAWKEIIPQNENALQSASYVGHTFFCSYLKDARTQVRVHDAHGTYVRDVEFPGICTAGGFGGEQDDTVTFYTYSGYTSPGQIYQYDIASGKSTLFRAPKVDFNPADFETTQVFLNSKDGTRLPMFISHKKGISLDGSNPTILYGYGGFNVPITPGFSPNVITWMEMGGVYAVATLRGGSEYGEDWHKGGMRLTKQNTFDDFIAAAEWLIANKYTSTPKLAINGGSNGGLLVGACMTQRPDLYGACIADVGVMDMLRFHKFTVGAGWIGDYGSADDPEEFKVLRSFSPYHNLKKGTCYPPTLITTGDHDDRVYPAHSFKFAAAAQWAQGCDNPILIRIETAAGHGAGKPTTKRIDETADKFAFLVRTLHMDPVLR